MSSGSSPPGGDSGTQTLWISIQKMEEEKRNREEAQSLIQISRLLSRAAQITSTHMSLNTTNP